MCEDTFDLCVGACVVEDAAIFSLVSYGIACRRSCLFIGESTVHRAAVRTRGDGVDSDYVGIYVAPTTTSFQGYVRGPTAHDNEWLRVDHSKTDVCLLGQ